MNRITLSIVTALVAASALTADDGWKTIFKGENLKGWKSSPDNPAAFSVETDGVLKVSGKRAHLYYVGGDGDASFSNFELTMEVKTLPQANSGVFFNTRFQEEGWPAYGYEAQVNSSHRDPRKSGSIYGVMDLFLNPEAFKKGQKQPFITFHPEEGTRLHVEEAPTKDDQWFTYHIKVVGKTVTLAIDGRTTAIYTEPDSLPATTRRLGTGTIAIQAHDPGSTVFYKDIQLKILD